MRYRQSTPESPSTWCWPLTLGQRSYPSGCAPEGLEPGWGWMSSAAVWRPAIGRESLGLVEVASGEHAGFARLSG